MKAMEALVGIRASALPNREPCKPYAASGAVAGSRDLPQNERTGRFDILIEVARGRDAGINDRRLDLSRSDLGILYSPISAAELWAGALLPEHDTLKNLFRALTCVPVDTETGRQAGDYLRRYRKSHGVELADAWIAATAALNNVALWTRNRKHYPMKDLSFF